MSSIVVATIALFAGLGTVALALAMLSRGYSRAVLGVGLAGLLPLAAASTWLVTSWPDDGAVELETLNQAVTTLRRANDELNQRNTGLQREIEALREKAARADQIPRALTLPATPAPTPSAPTTPVDDAEQRRLRTDLQRANDELAAARREIDRLKSLPPQIVQVPAPPQPTASGQSIRPVPAAPLPVADIPRAPPQAPVTPPAQPAATPRATATPQIASPPAATADLRRRLERPVSTAGYSVAPLAQKAMVEGKNGRWYVVRLTPDGRPLVFGDRKFRAPEAAAAVEAGSRTLAAEILGPLTRSGTPYSLYVRGHADGRNVGGPTDAPDSRELAVLTRYPGGAYNSRSISRALPATISNEHLPSLRADWLRRQVAPQLRVNAADIQILDTPPSRERTAELLLFVPW